MSRQVQRQVQVYVDDDRQKRRCSWVAPVSGSGKLHLPEPKLVILAPMNVRSWLRLNIVPVRLLK